MAENLLALQSVLGVILIPLFAWSISENRKGLGTSGALRVIATGLILQFVLVGALLLMPWTKTVFDVLGQAVLALQKATDAGAQLMFGYLAGGEAPFEAAKPQNSFIVAFRVLPMILVLSALVRLLYHWGVLQRIVQGFAMLLQRSFGTGGPLSTAAAASIFLGLVEAPLLIRPYLKEMGRGALFAAMAVSMATVAGTVMALYASILSAVVAGAAGHLLAASLINVPGALMLARLAVPDDFAGGPKSADIKLDDPSQSSVDAIAKGTSEGILLVAGVAAMLIVVVSLVALANSILALGEDVAGYSFHAAGTARLYLHAACAADRNPMERSGHRRPVDRPESRAERISGLSRTGEDADRGALRPIALVIDLCTVRFCQSRLARHFDRWLIGHGPRTPRRNRRHGPEISTRRLFDDVADSVGGWDNDLVVTACRPEVQGLHNLALRSRNANCGLAVVCDGLEYIGESAVPERGASELMSGEDR